MRKILGSIFPILGMLVLILDSKTALKGASEGVSLCIQVVVPSLFPFFFLSNYLTGNIIGKKVPGLCTLSRFFGIPSGAESLLIPAFLGGYPSGAQAISQARQSGSLTIRQAEQLLAFCSNTGPSFVFGILSQQFPGLSYPWLLWLIHILGALLSAFFFSCSDSASAAMPQNKITVSDALRSSLRIMATVSGWVVLFRILLSFLNRWFLWALPIDYQPILAGILELTNGCSVLSQIENVRIRFIICSGLLALGGLCVTMQTWSVTDGISKKNYYIGKLLQCLFSIFISICFLYKYWLLLPIVIAVPILIGKSRKDYSISAPVRV